MMAASLSPVVPPSTRPTMGPRRVIRNPRYYSIFIFDCRRKGSSYRAPRKATTARASVYAAEATSNHEGDGHVDVEGVRIALGLLDKRIDIAVREEDYATAAKLRDEKTETLDALSVDVQILISRLNRLCGVVVDDSEESSSSSSSGSGPITDDDRAEAANALMQSRDTRALPSLAAALRRSPGHVGDGNRQHSLVEMTMWHLFTVSGDPEVDARVQEGILAMRTQGREGLERARDVFTEVTRMKPDFAEGWNKRATINYLLRDLRASIDDCRRTLELNPSHFGALSGLGLCHLGLFEFSEADEAFTRALQVNPGMEEIAVYRRKLKGRIAEEEQMKREMMGFDEGGEMDLARGNFARASGSGDGGGGGGGNKGGGGGGGGGGGDKALERKKGGGAGAAAEAAGGRSASAEEEEAEERRRETRDDGDSGGGGGGGGSEDGGGE